MGAFSNCECFSGFIRWSRVTKDGAAKNMEEHCGLHDWLVCGVSKSSWREATISIGSKIKGNPKKYLQKLNSGKKNHDISESPEKNTLSFFGNSRLSASSGVIWYPDAVRIH